MKAGQGRRLVLKLYQILGFGAVKSTKGVGSAKTGLPAASKASPGKAAAPCKFRLLQATVGDGGRVFGRKAQQRAGLPSGVKCCGGVAGDAVAGCKGGV